MPFSLCHLDNTICTTAKSALLKLLQNETENIPPAQTDIIVFDRFFMIYLMKEVPLTFGKISNKILQMLVVYKASIIIIAFDRYVFPSIKDHEHILRGMRCSNFHISGSERIRPADFAVEMKNVYFKEALVNFMIDEWKNDCAAPFIGNKTIFVNYDKCYMYQVTNNHVPRSEDFDLSCPAHEEADTKMVYHICKINYEANITIRCSDTDVAIIMLENLDKTYKGLKIWMEVDVGIHHRFINITKLNETLGTQLSAALPALHALTGIITNLHNNITKYIRYYIVLFHMLFSFQVAILILHFFEKGKIVHFGCRKHLLNTLMLSKNLTISLK